MSDEEFEAAGCEEYRGCIALKEEARRARESEAAALDALAAIDLKLEHATCANSVNWPEWKMIKELLTKAGRR